MKLIALRNFRNTQNLDLDEDGKFDPIHESHVHKGAVLSIGGNKEFKDLSKTQQSIVFQLNAANCVGNANDKDVVARVKAEVDEDAKAEAKAKSAHAAGGNEHLVKTIIETLAGLGLISPKAAKEAK